MFIHVAVAAAVAAVPGSLTPFTRDYLTTMASAKATRARVDALKRSLDESKARWVALEAEGARWDAEHAKFYEEVREIIAAVKAAKAAEEAAKKVPPPASKKL